MEKIGGFDPNLHLADLKTKSVDLESISADLWRKSADLTQTCTADLSQTHSSGSEEESAARVEKQISS